MWFLFHCCTGLSEAGLAGQKGGGEEIEEGEAADRGEIKKPYPPWSPSTLSSRAASPFLIDLGAVLPPWPPAGEAATG
jgi:hypothetical protein